MKTPLLSKEWVLAFSEEEAGLDPSAGRIHVDVASIATQFVPAPAADVKPIRQDTRGKGSAKATKGVI